MESDEKTNDSGCISMHQTNDEICIGENVKIAQHDPGFEDSDEVNNGEHLKSPYSLTLSLNVENINACICQI